MKKFLTLVASMVLTASAFAVAPTIQMSQVEYKAFDLITKPQFEGWRGSYYRCPAGLPAIGWGFTNPAILMYQKPARQAGESNYAYNNRCWNAYMQTGRVKSMNRKTADAILLKYIRQIQGHINIVVHVKLNDNQIAALTSFIYNVGCDAFDGSQLLYKLNRGNYSGAAMEFGRWNKIHGQVSSGLTTRRQMEKAMFVK